MITDEQIAAAVRPLYADDTAASMGLADDIRTVRAVLALQPSASAEPDHSKCTVCRNSAGVGMTVCDACHASMGMATRALGASQTERIAGMLDGYVESIKEHGGTMLERWHYIPEIEDAAESLRAALQPSFPPPVTAAREQEAIAWLAENQDGSFDAYKDVHSLIDDCRQGFPVYATPTTSTTGKVDASRVRDEALSEAVGLYESEEVLAPVGNSPWGETHQEGWIDGTKAYRDAIRSLIGTPKSAEGEGA